MTKLEKQYNEREKRLAAELEKKRRKRERIAQEANRTAKQDGRSPCEPIDDLLDEYSPLYGYDN